MGHVSFWNINAQKSLWAFISSYSPGASFFAWSSFGCPHPPLLEGSLLLGNKSLVPWDLSHGSGRPRQPFLLWNRGGAGLGPPHIRAQLSGETLGQLFFPVWCFNLDSRLRIWRDQFTVPLNGWLLAARGLRAPVQEGWLWGFTDTPPLLHALPELVTSNGSRLILSLPGCRKKFSVQKCWDSCLKTHGSSEHPRCRLEVCSIHFSLSCNTWLEFGITWTTSEGRVLVREEWHNFLLPTTL